MIARTWRVRWEGDDIYRGDFKDVIISFWHQTIPTALGSHRNKNICVLVSLNRDGEMISRVAKRMGYSTIRGSSSSRGRDGFKEITETVSRNVPIAFTPDGPRGPFHSIAPGVLWASAVTGRTIYTFGVAADRKWEANSWDKMFMAKPFSRVVIRYDSRMGVVQRSEMKSKEARLAKAEELQQIMNDCEQEAYQALEDWKNE
ncbi:MAG: lysophospholipid acyltransferase family protein [Planctomycetota bacterium]|nr:lysophospholipid acyltransferase family protein [Planctomycetota bacterium]